MSYHSIHGAREGESLLEKWERDAADRAKFRNRSNGPVRRIRQHYVTRKEARAQFEAANPTPKKVKELLRNVCCHCGKPFLCKTLNSMYCSRVCSVTARKHRNLSRLSARKSFLEDTANHHYLADHRGGKMAINRGLAEERLRP